MRLLVFGRYTDATHAGWLTWMRWASVSAASRSARPSTSVKSSFPACRQLRCSMKKLHLCRHISLSLTCLSIALS